MTASSPEAIPTAAGLGLRHAHMAPIAEEAETAPRTTPWLEIHSENYLNAGGPRQAILAAIAQRYPISCHGVGLSLGSADGLDAAHLKRLADLFAWVKPGLVSEHLAWSVTDGVYLNDLLPLPYTAATLETVARNVEQAQAAFGRKILVENPSSYLSFAATRMTEPDFLNALVQRTGCGLLLDLNNIFVTCANTGANTSGDAIAYIDAIDTAAVGEMHLAGHSKRGHGDDVVLVDTHGTPVCAGVWDLYTHAIRRIGPCPTLLEWDTDIPDLPVLLEEVHRAQMVIDIAGAMPRVA